MWFLSSNQQITLEDSPIAINKFFITTFLVKLLHNCGICPTFFRVNVHPRSIPMIISPMATTGTINFLSIYNWLILNFIAYEELSIWSKLMRSSWINYLFNIWILYMTTLINDTKYTMVIIWMCNGGRCILDIWLFTKCNYVPYAISSLAHNFLSCSLLHHNDNTLESYYWV